MTLTRTILIGIVAGAIWLAAYVLIPLGSADAGTGRQCFPAAHWAPAPDGQRPCIRVTLYEDGSFGYRVTDADGTFRYKGGIGAAVQRS